MPRMLGLTIFFLAGAGACSPEHERKTSAAETAAARPPAAKHDVAAAKHDVLVEPKGPIDPKSAEAAGQVIQHYGALIEQGRWEEAEALWGEREAAARFSEALRTYPEVHVEIGDLGPIEGAAGSLYETMPVTFYGKNGGHTSFRKAAEIVVRRVNDVPGSTAAQRRWHIERIEWKAAP